MSDVVMKEEDSETLSVKELEVVLPQYQPFNGSSPSLNADSTPDFTSSYPHFFSVIKNLPPVPEGEDEVKLELMRYLNEYMELDAAAPVLPPDQPVPVNGRMSPSYFDYLPPSQIEYHRNIGPLYTPCPPSFSPPPPGDYNYHRSQDAINAKPLLFAKIAFHCYNLEKGTHFERLGLPRTYDQTVEARDRVRNYTCMFETNVRLVTENKDCFHAITTRCRPSPPPPGEDGFQCGFDTLCVDELFKGNMPDWLPDDYDATSSTLLMQYYEMKESEVEQAKEWLHLYAELALFNKIQRDPVMFDRSKPLELGKVVVQTRGAVKDVWLLDNAVFFITFKTSGGDVCKGIIRRTRDGIPEHLSLEAK